MTVQLYNNTLAVCGNCALKDSALETRIMP